MKKHVASAILLAAFAAFNLGTSKPKGNTETTTSATAAATPPPVSTPTATASAKPDKPEVPDPQADYKTMEDVNMDGNKATGKTALLRVRRGDTETDSFSAFSCDKAGGGYLKLSFEERDRNLVRGMPTNAFGNKCPRVHFKITGKEFYGNTFKGKVLAILDVEPAEAAVLPPGVDFASLQDIGLTGAKAAGKIAQMKMYKGTITDKSFYAYECKRDGSLLAHLEVNYKGDQKDAVKSLTTSSLGGCKSVKVKLTGQVYYSKTTWKAELLDVTD